VYGSPLSLGILYTYKLDVARGTCAKNSFILDIHPMDAAYKSDGESRQRERELEREGIMGNYM
jgi:hypothetical protein